FDIALLRDNKLHRFAYISAEGKVIRFFLINKREDRDSPVAVFDACMICGDMGYIKKDGQLICISCNVRIFLPSVGKSGGCNPIPLKYEYDGKKITIDVKDVIAGSN
ncbi:Fe-S-containing protein, partial [Campylobacter jejuni]